MVVQGNDCMGVTNRMGCIDDREVTSPSPIITRMKGINKAMLDKLLINVPHIESQSKSKSTLTKPVPKRTNNNQILLIVLLIA